MDSKKRHEMMTNELSDWLGHVPDFLKQYQNMLIGLALIVIGLISWPILNRWRQQSDFTMEAEVSGMLDSLEMGKYLAVRPNENQQDLTGGSFLVTANNLAEQARKAPTDNLAAIALIKQGQALRLDLLYRKENIAEDVVAAQIKQAQEAYQQAFDKAVMPVVKAMAQFGLGICSEELGQLDQAKEIYQKIAAEASYAGTPLPMAAEERIKKMTDHNTKYTFVEKPKAASAPLDIQAPALPPMPFASPPPAKEPTQTAPDKAEPAKTESSEQDNQ